MVQFKAVGIMSVCKMIEEESKSKSGLLLTDKTADNERLGMRKAEVVATNRTDIKVGDIVGYHKFYGQPYEVEGEKYIFLDETGTQCVYDE